MRDDLYKTVTVSAPWIKVLRCLDRRSPDSEIRQYIHAAVHADTWSKESVGGQTLGELLAETHADLISDGRERIKSKLLIYGEAAVSAAARGACEIALGILAEDGLTSDFRERVLRAAGNEQARSGIEHIAARVTLAHGTDEARQVRGRLLTVASGCDFSKAPQKPVARPRKSDAEMLDAALSLSL